MKKNKVWLILSFLSVLCILVLSGCGKNNSSSSNNGNKPLSGKTYTVAINATFPPFESTQVNKKNGETEYVGFDMDLLKKLSKDLGFKYKIKNMDFSGLIGTLQSKRADFVISGISPTKEREKTVDFSVPYFNVKTAILYKNSQKYTTLKSIKNVSVAAPFGTQYADLAKSNGSVVKALDNSTAAVQALKNGDVKAVVMDASQAGYLVKKKLNGYSYSIIPQSQTKGVASQFAMAFPKKSKLTKYFNKKIKEYKKNGTIKKLAIKWMGKEYVKNN